MAQNRFLHHRYPNLDHMLRFQLLKPHRHQLGVFKQNDATPKSRVKLDYKPASPARFLTTQRKVADMSLLDEAITEAERFLKSANECQLMSDNFISGCKYRADVKRKSMDLTRALSALRKAEVQEWGED